MQTPKKNLRSSMAADDENGRIVIIRGWLDGRFAILLPGALLDDVRTMFDLA